MSVTYQAEPFTPAIKEIQTFLDPHWQEVGTFREEFDREVDYQHYVTLERLDKLIFVTAREDDHLIGYCLGAIGNDPHRIYPDPPQTRVIMCSALVYYMVPAKRGYGGNLMRAFERAAVDRHVGIINQRAKPENNAGAFLIALGYTPVETTYSKLVGRAANAARKAPSPPRSD